MEQQEKLASVGTEKESDNDIQTTQVVLSKDCIDKNEEIKMQYRKMVEKVNTKTVEVINI